MVAARRERAAASAVAGAASCRLRVLGRWRGSRRSSYERVGSLRTSVRKGMAWAIDAGERLEEWSSSPAGWVGLQARSRLRRDPDLRRGVGAAGRGTVATAVRRAERVVVECRLKSVRRHVACRRRATRRSTSAQFTTVAGLVALARVSARFRSSGSSRLLGDGVRTHRRPRPAVAPAQTSGLARRSLAGCSRRCRSPRRS